MQNTIYRVKEIVASNRKDADSEWNAYYYGNYFRRTWKQALMKRICEYCYQYKGYTHNYATSFRLPKLLDFGCGSSPLAIEIPFSFYTGIDINTSKIWFMTGKQIPNTRYIAGGIDALYLLERQSYDIAVVSEVIEHLTLPEIDNLIKLLKDMLKDGGYLIIATPNYDSPLWHLIEWGQKRLQPNGHMSDHLTHFNGTALDILMRSLGLIKVNSSKVMGGCDMVLSYEVKR